MNVSDEDLGRMLLAAFVETNTEGKYMSWHSEPANSENVNDAVISEGTLSVCLDDWFDFVKIAKLFVGHLEEKKNA